MTIKIDEKQNRIALINAIAAARNEIDDDSPLGISAARHVDIDGEVSWAVKLYADTNFVVQLCDEIDASDMSDAEIAEWIIDVWDSEFDDVEHEDAA